MQEALKACRPLLCTTLIATSLVGFSAQAMELVPVRYEEDQGAAERVAAADRLRTVSYEVASASCHLFNGISTEESRRLVVESLDSFKSIAVALREGDPEMNILYPETDRRVLTELGRLEEAWTPVEAAIDNLMDNPSDSDAWAIARDGGDRLSAIAADLVHTVVAQHSNPMDLLQSDAVLLDIVGRQAMLTQKIAEKACEVGAGDTNPELVAALSESQQFFELGMRALLDGMPELGIKPAPTEGIRFALQGIMADWSEIQLLLATVHDGSIDVSGKEDLFARLTEKMYKLEELVVLYTEHSKYHGDTPSGG